MKLDLRVSAGAEKIVADLKSAGFETYIVGGAVRDLLLDREPKDFDISTSATPEEIRQVFGRRQARIIGKRFRLVHVFMNGEIYEVSTFRSAPEKEKSSNPGSANGFADYDERPENMILNDNFYGTATDDVWRRDFTVNALFYDPLTKEVLDLTGMGLEDISKRVVRAIGRPVLRFEEDPVRMLRALKLVAQFDFSLEAETENALFASLHLLHHASVSRLTLELEKILKSSFCDRHLEVFHDYGLLPFFLPELSKSWGTAAQKKMCDLLYERNCRIDAGLYRNSVSLALAAAAFPYVGEALSLEPGQMWQDGRSPEVKETIRDVVDNIFSPMAVMVRVREAAYRILQMQSALESGDRSRRGELMQQRAYSHARELMLIRHAANGEDISETASIWPRGVERSGKVEFFPRKKAKIPVKKRGWRP